MKKHNEQIARWLGWELLSGDFWRVPHTGTSLVPDFEGDWSSIMTAFAQVRRSEWKAKKEKRWEFLRFEIGKHGIFVQVFLYRADLEDNMPYVYHVQSHLDSAGDCETWQEVWFKTLLDLSQIFEL